MPSKEEPRYRVAHGPDIDLEREDIRDSRGRRITPDYVESAVDDVHQKLRRGRPSLTPEGTASPQVTFRLPARLRRETEDQARREGTAVSSVARKALEEYIERHRHAS